MGMTDSQFKALIRLILSEYKTIEQLQDLKDDKFQELIREKKEEFITSLQSMLED